MVGKLYGMKWTGIKSNSWNWRWVMSNEMKWCELAKSGIKWNSTEWNEVKRGMRGNKSSEMECYGVKWNGRKVEWNGLTKKIKWSEIEQT